MTQTDIKSTAEYKTVILPMLNAAAKAVHIALKRRKEGISKGTKPDGSFITNGDYQAQQVIELELKQHESAIAESFDRRTIQFTGEEDLDGKKTDLSTLSKGMHWVVDPIDGTIGYSQEKNSSTTYPWAVSIALVKDGRTVSSVIYEAGANEYGNTESDRKSIDPLKPSGTFYFAHEGLEKAHAVQSLTMTLPVRISDRPYVQQDKNLLSEGIKLANNEKPIQTLTPDALKSLYESLNVNTEKAKYSSIAEISQPPDETKPIELDSIAQDEKAVGTPYKDKLKAACTNFETIDCKSAVAGAMRAATGRASGFMMGLGWPWDHAASWLILKKSGTPCVKYNVPGEENRYRTMVIAGQNSEAFKTIDDTIRNMKDQSGNKIVSDMPMLQKVFNVAAGALSYNPIRRDRSLG